MYAVCCQVTCTTIGSAGAQALQSQAVGTSPAGGAREHPQTAATASRRRAGSASAACVHAASQLTPHAPPAVSLSPEQRYVPQAAEITSSPVQVNASALLLLLLLCSVTYNWLQHL